MGILDIVGQEVRVTRTLDLGDFAEAYRGATFEVNVTPTRGHVQEWLEIVQHVERAAKGSGEDPIAAMAEYNERLDRWLGSTWSMAVGEVKQIREALQEKNPLAWEWLYKRTFEVIGDYRKEVLKN